MAVREAGKPLIPDVDALTSQIREHAAATEFKDAFELAETQTGSDTNVEQLLTHVRALRAVAGGDEIRGFTTEQLEGLEKLICEYIFQATDKKLPSVDTPYHRLAAWCGYTERLDPVELFTPNYDLLIEESLKSFAYPILTGSLEACDRSSTCMRLRRTRCPHAGSVSGRFTVPLIGPLAARGS